MLAHAPRPSTPGLTARTRVHSNHAARATAHTCHALRECQHRAARRDTALCVWYLHDGAVHRHGKAPVQARQRGLMARGTMAGYARHLAPRAGSPVPLQDLVPGGAAGGWVVAPLTLIAAYGAARAGTTLFNEGRNMVFAKVRWVARPATARCSHTRPLVHLPGPAAATDRSTHSSRLDGRGDARSCIWRFPTRSAVGALCVCAQVTQGAIRRVAGEVFRHLHSLELQFHLNRQTGAPQCAAACAPGAFWFSALDAAPHRVFARER